MRVELGPLPYQYARELIEWCAHNDIDRLQAFKLLEAWCDKDIVIADEDWFLDIPDQYVTYFMMKWA